MTARGRTIRIVDDAESMARAAADIVVDTLQQAVVSRGSASIALSGGGTPRRLYELLTTDSSLYRRMPWPAVDFFWGDERQVPPDHPQSNFRMAEEVMLSRAPVPAQHVHRMGGESADVMRAAAAYEVELQRVFGLSERQWPRFDLVLLGMGADGHTASLFPYSAALAERRRLVTAQQVEKLDIWRITMTVPLINHAAHVMFLVTGAEKADALSAVLAPEGDAQRFPARLIQPLHGHLTWIVDRAAAGARQHPRVSNNR